MAPSTSPRTSRPSLVAGLSVRAKILGLVGALALVAAVITASGAAGMRDLKADAAQASAEQSAVFHALASLQDGLWAVRNGISAVPGSGKIFTLSRLAANILLQNQLGMDQEILVVTLVNSAVDNFSERIGQFIQRRLLIPGLGYRIRTLHGLAHDIVRERPSLVNLANDFSIIDEGESIAIREQVALAWLRANPNFFDGYLDPELKVYQLENIRTKELSRLVQGISLNFIRYAKDRELTPEEINQTMVKFDIPPDRPVILQVSRFDRCADAVHLPAGANEGTWGHIVAVHDGSIASHNDHLDPLSDLTEQRTSHEDALKRLEDIAVSLFWAVDNGPFVEAPMASRIQASPAWNSSCSSTAESPRDRMTRIPQTETRIPASWRGVARSSSSSQAHSRMNSGPEQLISTAFTAVVDSSPR